MSTKLTRKKGESANNLDYVSLIEKRKKSDSFFIKHDYETQQKLGLEVRSIEADVFETVMFYLGYYANSELAYSVQQSLNFTTDSKGVVSFCLPLDFFMTKLYTNKSSFYDARKRLLDAEIFKSNGSYNRKELYTVGKKVWDVIIKGKEFTTMARRPDRNKTAGMEKAGVETEVEKQVIVKTPMQKAAAFLLKIKNKIKQSEPDVVFNAHKDIGSKSVVRKFIEDLSPTDEELELCAEYYVNGWFGGASVKTRLVGVYFKVDSGGAGNTMENAKAWDKAGRPKERPSKFKDNQNIGKGSKLSDEEKAEYIKKYRGGK